MKLLHGTSTANLDRIESEGIAPAWLTDLPDMAWFFAGAAAVRDGGEPIVLIVDVSTRRLKEDSNMVGNPVDPLLEHYGIRGMKGWERAWGQIIRGRPSRYDGRAANWKWSLATLHSVEYDGLIPSEAIVRILELKAPR